MRIRSLCLALLLLVFCAAPSPAAETAKPATAPVADKPVRITERNTPVSVAFDNMDSIGARLSTRVKEVLNASNLFTLTEKNAPKFRVILSTTPEFPSRPGVGSAYSVIWVFAQSDTTLPHYLAGKTGVLTPEQINDVAAEIIARTDELAVRYGYLFQ